MSGSSSARWMICAETRRVPPSARPCSRRCGRCRRGSKRALRLWRASIWSARCRCPRRRRRHRMTNGRGRGRQRRAARPGLARGRAGAARRGRAAGEGLAWRVAVAATTWPPPCAVRSPTRVCKAARRARPTVRQRRGASTRATRRLTGPHPRRRGRVRRRRRPPSCWSCLRRRRCWPWRSAWPTSGDAGCGEQSARPSRWWQTCVRARTSALIVGGAAPRASRVARLCAG